MKKTRKWLSVAILSIIMAIFAVTGSMLAFAEVTPAETGAIAKGTMYVQQKGNKMFFHFDTSHLGLSSMHYETNLEGDSNLSAEETETFLKKVHIQVNQAYVDEMTAAGKTPKFELNTWYTWWEVAQVSAGTQTYVRPKVYYRNSANTTGELILVSDSAYFYHNGGSCEFTTDKHLAKIKFDAGIYFVDGSKQKIESTVTTYPVGYVFPEGGFPEGNVTLSRLAESITINDFNESQNVVKNADANAINLEGATITVNYGGQTETVALDKSYITAVNANEIGVGTVTISFGGVSVQKSVNVVDPFKSIAIITQPTKLTYTMGVDSQLDLTGMVVEATLNDGVNAEDYDTNIAVTTDMCSGYDYLVAGTQTITLTYGAFTTTFDVEVVDENPDSYIEFLYGASTTFPDQPDLVCLGFNLVNITPLSLDSGLEGKFGAIWHVEGHGRNVFDKIKLYCEGLPVEGAEDGWYTVEQLMQMKDGYGNVIIDIVSQYGYTLLFHTASGYHGVNNGYEVGTYFNKDMVTKIRIEAGFYWVQHTAGGGDNWGGAYPAVGYKMIPNAILRETFEVEVNALGIRWIRALKKDAEGDVAEDALTVVTQPTKTEYLLNETLDVTGMTVNVKYNDGGEEVVTITEEMVGYHDFSTVGEHQVYVTYNEERIYFTVTVVEENTGDNSSDTIDTGSNESSSEEVVGCFGSASVCTGFAIIMLALGGFVSKKKRA